MQQENGMTPNLPSLEGSLVYNPVYGAQGNNAFNPNRLGTRPAHEIIAGRTVAAGATLTPLTMNNGDTLTIRSGIVGGRAFITDNAVLSQASGKSVIIGPTMHDTTSAYTARHTLAQPYSLWPLGYLQEVLYNQLLTASLTGSAVALDQDLMAISLMYTNYPLGQININERELWFYNRNIVTTEHSIVTAAGNQWTGSQPISAGSVFTLQQDRYYALMGFEVNTNVGALAIRGTDTAGLRRGFIGNSLNKGVDREYMIGKARSWGDNIPVIPAVWGGNMNQTFLDLTIDENLGTVICTLFWAELANK